MVKKAFLRPLEENVETQYVDVEGAAFLGVTNIKLGHKRRTGSYRHHECDRFVLILRRIPIGESLFAVLPLEPGGILKDVRFTIDREQNSAFV